MPRTPLIGTVMFVQRFGGLVKPERSIRLIVRDGLFLGQLFDMLPVLTDASNVLAIR